MEDRNIVMQFWNSVTAFAKKKKLLEKGDSLLLAVSGGPDSVVLLDYFAGRARKMDFDLTICHVNHNLRGADAEADADFVRKLGERYKIKTVVCSANVKEYASESGTGIESAARKLRYQLLLDTARKRGCSKIVTAHHGDDNAETILLNMLRGTNPKGLLGIPAVRPIFRRGRKTVWLIRPFLCVGRADIEDYIRKLDLKACKDKTNDDEYFTRNWIRNTLLPLMSEKQPQIRRHLTEFSDRLRKYIRSEEEL